MKPPPGRATTSDGSLTGTRPFPASSNCAAGDEAAGAGRGEIGSAGPVGVREGRVMGGERSVLQDRGQAVAGVRLCSVGTAHVQTPEGSGSSSGNGS